MTDGEIDTVLSELNEYTCNNFNVPFDDIIQEIFCYIVRLKNANYKEYCKNTELQAYIDNHEEVWKRNAEIDKSIVRKETAKEILQRLIRTYKEVSPIISVLTVIAKEYGVEVGEE